MDIMIPVYKKFYLLHPFSLLTSDDSHCDS